MKNIVFLLVLCLSGCSWIGNTIEKHDSKKIQKQDTSNICRQDIDVPCEKK